jgi:hypothetical protein
MNENGMAENLVASHPGDTSAVRSGVFSRSGRILAPRAAEIAREIMSVGHVREVDELAAEEIGRIVAGTIVV